MTIVVDGWEVDVNRFEKKVGQFTIAIRQTPVDGAASPSVPLEHRGLRD